MSQVLSFINQGWVGSIIGLVGILIGISGIFFFRAAKTKPRPVFQVDTLRLIENRGHELPDEVSISYRGAPVQRLTKTNLIFWNAGADTLRWSDVVSTDPLRMVFDKGSEILRADIVKTTRDINVCKLVIDQSEKNSLQLEFDFLDPGDGASIEILHTSKSRAPTFLGSIRGVPEGVINWGRILTSQRGSPPLPRILRAPKPIFIIGIVLGLFIIVFGLISDTTLVKLSEDIATNDKGVFLKYFFIVLGIIYAALPAFLLWSGRKRFPKSLDFEKEKGEKT